MKVSDIIIIAWQKGQISEGKAAKLIGVDRLTLRTMAHLCDAPQIPVAPAMAEKVYSTMLLVEHLHNALENGYEELGATDIGDLLMMCEVKPEESNGVPFCEVHEIPMELTDYDDESRYECPECKREDGEVLGLM